MWIWNSDLNEKQTLELFLITSPLLSLCVQHNLNLQHQFEVCLKVIVIIHRFWGKYLLNIKYYYLHNSCIQSAGGANVYYVSALLDEGMVQDLVLGRWQCRYPLQDISWWPASLHMLPWTWTTWRRWEGTSEHLLCTSSSALKINAVLIFILRSHI